MSQARHYDSLGLFIPEECVDISEDSEGFTAKGTLTNEDLQKRDFDFTTGLYTIKYSLTGFRDREAVETIPSRETVDKAINMIEKDLCFKFQEVDASDLDPYHLHLYGKSIKKFYFAVAHSALKPICSKCFSNQFGQIQLEKCDERLRSTAWRRIFTMAAIIAPNQMRTKKFL